METSLPPLLVRFKQIINIFYSIEVCPLGRFKPQKKKKKSIVVCEI